MRRTLIAAGFLLPLTIGCWLAQTKSQEPLKEYTDILAILEEGDNIQENVLRDNIIAIMQGGRHGDEILDLFGRIAENRQLSEFTRRTAAIAAYEQAHALDKNYEAEYFRDMATNRLR